jgi:hypothetical protein
MDKTLSMEQQVRAVTKSWFHQIRNIGKIRPFITENDCKTLVCYLVTSPLDYGNLLLYGVINYTIETATCAEYGSLAYISKKETRVNYTSSYSSALVTCAVPL